MRESPDSARVLNVVATCPVAANEDRRPGDSIRSVVLDGRCAMSRCLDCVVTIWMVPYSMANSSSLDTVHVGSLVLIAVASAC